jgi:hypothetical protein
MTTEASIKEAGRIRDQKRQDCILLARRVAMGEDISPEEIAAACVEGGMEIIAFGSLCRSLKTRAALRLQAAERQQIENEIAAIEETCNREAATLEEASQRHWRIVTPLGQKHYELTRKLCEIRAAPSDLARSCPDVKLNAERKRLELEGRQLSEQYRDAQGEVERLRLQHVLLAPDSEDAGRFGRAITRAEAVVADVAKRIQKNTAASEANFQARIDF